MDAGDRVKFSSCPQVYRAMSLLFLLQTASESEARARAASEGEASAARAARAVTAACESVAQGRIV